MTVSTTFPIKQAIVQRLRLNTGPTSYVFPAGDYAIPSRTAR
jgi:hypothetical protein